MEEAGEEEDRVEVEAEEGRGGTEYRGRDVRILLLPVKLALETELVLVLAEELKVEEVEVKLE